MRLGKGFLTQDDFTRAFERIHTKLKPEAIEASFKYADGDWELFSFILLLLRRQLDVDGDGRVSYRDFDFMMNYAAEE